MDNSITDISTNISKNNLTNNLVTSDKIELEQTGGIINLKSEEETSSPTLSDTSEYYTTDTYYSDAVEIAFPLPTYYKIKVPDLAKVPTTFRAQVDEIKREIVELPKDLDYFDLRAFIKKYNDIAARMTLVYREFARWVLAETERIFGTKPVIEFDDMTIELTVEIPERVIISGELYQIVLRAVTILENYVDLIDFPYLIEETDRVIRTI